MSSSVIKADVVRSVSFGSITSSYANLGSALTEPLIIMTIKNTTNVTIFISEDGTNDHYELPAGTTDVYDMQTNSRSGQRLSKKIGLQFKLKGVGGNLPTSGKVILQGQYI